MIKEMNKKVFGYMGKTLYIDLTTQSFSENHLPIQIADLLLGGRGFGVAGLFEHFNGLKGKYDNPFAKVDPLCADNVIVLSTSAATGTRVPTSGRLHMSFKSPLTRALGSTNGGGHFSAGLKRTGFDRVAIKGKAPDPCVVVISNSSVQFKKFSKSDEMDSISLRKQIRDFAGKKAHALTIGKAGRTQCLFASVMTDSGKALGRGGGGAVFGSKNLYGVAVVPDPVLNVKVAHPENLSAKNSAGAAGKSKLKLNLGKFTKKEEFFGILPSLGSLGILGMIHHFGQLIHNNMKDTAHRLEDINAISGEALRNHEKNAGPEENRIRVKKGGCFNCPVLCKRNVTIIDPEGREIEKGEGPEFESATLLGANLSIYNLELILKANLLANSYGLDTISLGSTIAAFFELYQKVKKSKTGEPPEVSKLLADVKDLADEYGEPGFGNEKILLPLIHLIGQGEGIGKSLAQGAYRFCKKFGHPEYAMTVKRLELPAYDPRGSFSQALCYEMNNRGGCHLEGGYTAPQSHCAGYGEWPLDRIEGTPLISRNAALKNTSLDIMGLCAYGGFSMGLDEYAALVNAVTGKAYNSGMLEIIAERVITLERQFNLLCGLTAADDILPDRFYNETIISGGKTRKLDRESFLTMRKKYYESFGWDETGIPKKETLIRLSLIEIIDPAMG